MITIDSLVKKYGCHRALNNISLSIPDQSICAIVGPNGAGKSTLLKILTQILSYDSGSIDYGSTVDLNTFRQSISYLPEQRGLYAGVDIETQLVYFANIRGVGDKAAKKNVEHWLRRFEISNWRSRLVSELSKGMQQKVQFISSLVNNPKVLFMDEPFTGVDPVNFRLFAEVLKEYQKQSNATVILSTHNMKSVEELCSDVVLLSEGDVEIAGNVEAVKQSFSKGNVLSLDIAQRGEVDSLEDVQAKLSTAFKIESARAEDGHLFVEISDPKKSLYSDIMRQALSILEGYEVYQCSRKTRSMEDIFIELSKK